MAEPLSTTKKSASDDDDDVSVATPAAPSTTSKAQSPLQIALRVLIGFGGLALLVGFFLPWYRESGVGDRAGTFVEHSGLTLATSTNGMLVGTLAPLLFLVPALGIALTAVAFMGFRWSAQVAVGVAVGLIGYTLYVLLTMFVQHTALGLWVVAASVFLVLLLGVVAWMTGREPRKKDEPDEDTEPAKP
ncbi:hypothetical protein [Sandaracinus amylolyticus]|uniref:hypothetical protein n=1 Tax=Sandaracinus amylolyticus TaxID=927083 RepID=UPI001F3C2144|nr:hypothetical protein [Sandaracinus amylolyticus]UJR78303.1 Hypothetical protein I5071_3300 [Sandaracinus amylolyticus]